MKKVLCALLAILLVSAMTLTAFAEKEEDVPSPTTVLDNPVVTDAEGNEISGVTIVPIGKKDDASEEVKAALEEAYKAMEAAESIGDLIPECAGMVVVDIAYLEVNDEEILAFLNDGGYVTAKAELKMDIADDAKMCIARFNDGEWTFSEEENVDILEDGTIVMHLNQPGVFALLIG